MSVTTLHNYFFDSTDYSSGNGTTISDQTSLKKKNFLVYYSSNRKLQLTKN